MPEKFEIDGEDAKFFKPQRRSWGIFDCLKDNEPWRFVPGTDFKVDRKNGRVAKVDMKRCQDNFVAMCKTWCRSTTPTMAIRRKAMEDGSLILQRYEMSDKQIARNQKLRERTLTWQAEQKMTDEMNQSKAE